jgi:UPF0271 protein
VAAIDLNSDLGEGVGDDAAIFGLVTSANVACGGHAGDEDSMRACVALAIERGVSLGAHPSYPDREGFGRRDVELDPGELRDEVLRQVAALTAIAASAGTRVRYLKPHGALYNRIVSDPVQADAVALAAREADLPLLGLAGSAIHLAADRHGVGFFREAFADRAYLPDGALAPRSIEGSVIADQVVAAERAVRMAVDGTVVALDGAVLRVELDSLCVHGDTPGAVAMAATVRERLAAAGVELRACA